MNINIISQNLIGTYMKTNWPNRCLLFVSSKFLQAIESLRIKTKSFKSCWGLWVSTICCRAGVAGGQKFLKELRNFQKSFDNFRNELQKWCCLKRRKTDNIFRFIAPVLCVISLSCCFQINRVETSLWRSLLPNMWQKVYFIYQSWLTCIMFYRQRDFQFFSNLNFGGVNDENRQITLLKESLFYFLDSFFASVTMRSFHHIIYFDISSRAFWCKCCQFSVDLSQDFGSI